MLYATGLTGVPLWSTEVVAMDAGSTASRQVARTNQEVHCLGGGPGMEVICLASDRARTRIWQASQGRLLPIGEVGTGIAGGVRLSRDEVMGWSTTPGDGGFVGIWNTEKGEGGRLAMAGQASSKPRTSPEREPSHA